MSSLPARRRTLLPGRAIAAGRLYLYSAVAFGLANATGRTTYALYLVATAELSALQLVALGITLQVTSLLCEVPAAVLADARSRRLSVVLGYGAFGMAFLVIGSTQQFMVLMVGQAILGMGWALISGAREAWLADEVGVQRSGPIYLRAYQLAFMLELVSIPLAVLLATWDPQLPLLTAGLCWLALALGLACTMTEDGYRGSPGHARRVNLAPIREAARTLRHSPALLLLAAAGFLLGAWKESFDRLAPLHFVQLGPPSMLSHAAWFGVIIFTSTLGSMVLVDAVRRWGGADRERSNGLWLTALTGCLAISGGVFAVTRSGGVAVSTGILGIALRAPVQPLVTIRANVHAPSSARATTLSLLSQLNSLGCVIGAAGTGLVAARAGTGVAILAISLVLLVTAPMYLTRARDRPAPRRL